MHGFLELLLPGFRWLSPGSFVLGLFESLVFGGFAGWLLAVDYNWVSKNLS